MGAAFWDRLFLLQPVHPAPELAQFLTLVAGQAVGLDPGVEIDSLEPLAQRLTGDIELAPSSSG